MNNEVRYFKDMQIPLNITNGLLEEKCKEKDIYYDRIAKNRCYRFYAKSESDMRWLQTILILKDI